MNQGITYRIDADAAKALAEWKAFFAEQVAMNARKLAQAGSTSDVITLDHFRQAVSPALQQLASVVQDNESNDGGHKQPNLDAGTVDDAFLAWNRQLLKHLEVAMAETGQQLQSTRRQ